MEAEWHRMIREAAYLRAEKRGFAPGHALDDWLLAEQDIKALIAHGRSADAKLPTRLQEKGLGAYLAPPRLQIDSP